MARSLVPSLDTSHLVETRLLPERLETNDLYSLAMDMRIISSVSLIISKINLAVIDQESIYFTI